MKNAIVFILVLIGIVLYGCNKIDGPSGPEVTVGGYIYNKADSTAYDNTSFVLYQHWSGSPLSSKKPEEQIIPFTTDSNGYFLVTFRSLKHEGTANIFWPNDYGPSNIPIYKTGFSQNKDSLKNLKIYAR